MKDGTNRLPSRYSTAVMVRVHPDERDELNRLANAAGISLQRYCRIKLGLQSTSRVEGTKKNETHPEAR